MFWRAAAGPRIKAAAALPAMVVLLLCFVTGAWADSTGSDSGLAARRADKRAAMREAVAASEQPASFALLVIPVDFADERLPEGWQPETQLGSRLFPLSGESLANYFFTASGGRLELDIVLAPLIHLPGNKLEYSDEGWAGFARTRLLATEAVEGAAAGLDFRLLDNDGPDRRPGTMDDDGEIDGILLLHSGIGDENNTEAGVIQALSFYLDEPVTRDGVYASSYSVASLHSGTGIWAHETAHLLGLEDRYDLFMGTLPGEVRSRGGLGIFSLMAAGAWGPQGDGFGAALLDAYSAAQLGWCEIVARRGDGAIPDTLRSVQSDGLAWRVWTKGETGPEYFLLETRGDPQAAPFDAGIGPGHLLVMHVDETLPEGQQSASPRHIRVRVLEADGDGLLGAGLDSGSGRDVFPGTLGVTELTPHSSPSSDSYVSATEVSLTGITSIQNGVVLNLSDFESPGVEVEISFASGSPGAMDLKVNESGTPLASVIVNVSTDGGQTWGSFAGGAQSISVDMEAAGDGRWIPVTSPVWYPDPDLPDGAETAFRLEIESGGWVSETFHRAWIWTEDVTVLDFETAWPGDWTILQAGDDRTTWHRWDGVTTPVADNRPVLACTGAEFPSSDSWPDVYYHNRADVTLQSGPLPENIAGVSLLHAFDGEAVRDGRAFDGAVVEYLMGDGRVLEAIPLDAYTGILDPGSTCHLHGRRAFVGEADFSGDGDLQWRLDVFPIPQTPVRPVRFRLRMASDSLWRQRGWFIADLEFVENLEAATPDLVWSAAGEVLRWNDFDGSVQSWSIESYSSVDEVWSEVWAGTPDDVGSGLLEVPLEDFVDLLPSAGRTRNLLRLNCGTDAGDILSDAVVFYLDGGAASPGMLGAPYVNVRAGTVRLLVDLPSRQSGVLRVYDVRGRLLRDWEMIGGRQFLEWNGRDKGNSYAAAGVYLFMLDAGGSVATRKVVLLR